MDSPRPPLAKKTKKQESEEKSLSSGKEPSLSRLTARQLTVARLVSSYKYECKKVLQSIGEQQRKWKREIEGFKTDGSAMTLSPAHFRSEMDTHSLSTISFPVEEGSPWKQTERDVLKKSFLAIGFGRWEEVVSLFRRSQKSSKHGEGEIEDACWELVAAWEPQLQGEELTYVQRKLESVRHRLPIVTAGAPWNRAQCSGKIWARRLMLLEHIAALHQEMQTPDSKALFKRTLSAMSDATPPAPWWNSDMDLMLISGVYIHGYGNYEELKSDPEIVALCRRSCTDLDRTQDMNARTSRGQTILDWPSTETLTKRLKRDVDILMKVQANIKTKDPDQNPRPATPREWTKQEKLDLVKSLLAFGLPQDLVNPSHSPEAQHRFSLEMGVLLTHAGIVGVSLPEARRLCMEILREMETSSALNVREGSTLQVPCINDPGLQRKQNVLDPSGTLTNLGDEQRGVLTQYSAEYLRERLEMLRVLKSHVYLLKQLDFVETLKGQAENAEMPPWWVPAIHDHELLSGMIVHGFGSWQQIFNDLSFSFSRCLAIFEQTQKCIAVLCTPDQSPVAAADRVMSELGMPTDLSMPTVAIPSAQLLMSRCKLLCCLMNQHAQPIPQVESEAAQKAPQLPVQPDWLAKLGAGAAGFRTSFLGNLSAATQSPQHPSVIPVRPSIVTSCQSRTITLPMTQSFPSLQQQLRPGYTFAFRSAVPFTLRDDRHRQDRSQIPQSRPPVTSRPFPKTDGQ